MTKHRPQPRNIYGQALTLRGTLDQRHGRIIRKENDGKPYRYFEVVHKPTDTWWPWHVISTDAETGEAFLIGRHRKEKGALRAAVILRINQPNRIPSRKLKHKLGLLTPRKP